MKGIDVRQEDRWLKQLKFSWHNYIRNIHDQHKTRFFLTTS